MPMLWFRGRPVARPLSQRAVGAHGQLRRQSGERVRKFSAERRVGAKQARRFDRVGKGVMGNLLVNRRPGAQSVGFAVRVLKTHLRRQAGCDDQFPIRPFHREVEQEEAGVLHERKRAAAEVIEVTGEEEFVVEFVREPASRAGPEPAAFRVAPRVGVAVDGQAARTKVGARGLAPRPAQGIEAIHQRGAGTPGGWRDQRVSSSFPD